MKKPSLSELTLREKIGQTVMLAPRAVGNVDDVIDFFKENPYGNMWTAGHMKMDFVNTAYEASEYGTFDLDMDKKLKNFADCASKVMKVPFLPSLDCEKGPKNLFPYFTDVASATGIGACDDEEIAYKIGKSIAHQLVLAGARWVWGPVVDNPSPLCAASLTRPFSSDPQKIIKLAKAYINGVQSESVAATLKHFPGSDRDDYRDSHFSDKVLSQNYDEWYVRQGVVFKELIDAGVYSVMIGHEAFPAIDDTIIDDKAIPATLSYKIITGLLKEKFGFKGVVITDAVDMRAITGMFDDPEDRYAMLYNAGNDVILGPSETDYIDIIERAISKGKIPVERIDDACQRVLDMKEKIGMFEREEFVVTEEMRQEAVEAAIKVNREAAPKIVTWVSRKNNFVPVKKENIKRVHIVYIGYSKDIQQRLDVAKEEFERHGAVVSFSEGIKSEAHMKEISENNDLIVYFAHIANHSPYGCASFANEKATQFLNVLCYGKEKSICASTGSPFIYHDWFSCAKLFVNLYCAEAEILKAFVRGIYGECEFSGVSPMNLNPLAPRI